ncbi:MAG TPA: GAF domain-containing sensor histidine kinase [Streptosporangiaceae bacterium]|nr:GAF domain-containing sensor histidine kinase [Streptosporangiaceae bacterium]
MLGDTSLSQTELSQRELSHGDSLRLLHKQTAVLGQLASGAPLVTVLTSVVVALEELIDGARCSILLLDADTATLHHGAAPTLPASYAEAIDGLTIGPDAGSCGTAAYLGAPVIAEDIAADPRWERYRGTAMPHGLRACWSSPINGRGGCMGTFAVYHDHAHRPGPRERELVRQFSHLASIAIDHERLFGARREAEVARGAAESASQAKSAFLTALSHELRTPLQAISGFAELMGTLPLSQERRTAALGHIQDATAHIAALVDDVLDIAKVEAGALPLQLTDLDAATIIQDALDLVSPLAAERGVTLRPGPAAGTVRADERRLRQVLINLVTNAVRYNRPEGTVEVSATPADRVVTIDVTDTGPGIPAGQLGRLFVAFDRLSAEHGHEQGAGLGLPLARGLAEAMGGQLTVTSHPNAGSTFTVRLPRAR